MTDLPGSLPPAGWYPDPADPTGRRYWDGSRWTQHTLGSAWDRPAAQPQSEGAPEAAAESTVTPENAGWGPTPAAAADGSEGPQFATEPAADADQPPGVLAGEPAPQAGPDPGDVPPPADPAEPQPAGAAGEPQAPVELPTEAGPPQAAPVGWNQPADAAGGGWTQPYTAAPMPYPGHEAYLPQTAPLTNSGMRRVAAMFSDMGRVLKRAWWQIIVISLAIWVAWSLLATAIAATLVDFGRLTEALNLAVTAANDYPSGRYPEELADQIRESFEAVPRTSSVWVWVLVGTLIVVLYGLAASLQVVAVNRLGMDAAAGHEVRLGPALRSGLIGGLRLFGYYLLFTVLLIAAILIVALLIAATSSVPPLLALLLMAVMVGSVVLALFLIGRLAPITAQVALGRGALGWTWRATRTKFWGVLGRYLLWALVAGIIGQVVLSIVSIPFFLASTASLAGDALAITPTVALTWVAMTVLSLVISAITYVGIVPIWRDLTDDPAYRSIADGQPLPDPL